MKGNQWVIAMVAAGSLLAGGLSPAMAQYQTPAKPAPAAQPCAAKPAQPCAAKTAATPAQKKAVATKVASGKVKSVSPDALVLEIPQKDKTTRELSFAFDAKTTIKAGRKTVTVNDVKEGDTARVSYVEAKGKLVAKSIVLRGVK